MIKKVSLRHCKKILKNNDPEETMKEVCVTREELTKQRLKENTNKVFEANKESFDEVVNKFKSNNKRNCDFLIKATEDYKDVVFLMCRRFIERETFPQKFNKQYSSKYANGSQANTKKTLQQTDKFIARSGCREQGGG